MLFVAFMGWGWLATGSTPVAGEIFYVLPLILLPIFRKFLLLGRNADIAGRNKEREVCASTRKPPG